TELSQTTTETTTKEIGKAVVERREQERERMRRPVRPTREVSPEKPKPAEVVRKEPLPPALLPIEPAVRFGTWTQVFGDYQKRDANGPGTLNCCPPGSNLSGGGLGITGINVPPNLALNIESRASTVGFVAGADLTSSGLYSASDGFIAGVTAGYTWSELKLNTVATDLTSTSLNPTKVGTGLRNLRPPPSGPAVRGYPT